MIEWSQILMLGVKMTLLMLVGLLLFWVLDRDNPRWRILCLRGLMVALILLPVFHFQNTIRWQWSFDGSKVDAAAFGWPQALVDKVVLFVAILWLVGIVFKILQVIGHKRQVDAWKRQAKLAPDALQDISEDVALRVGVDQPIPVLQMDRGLWSPFVTGWRHPAIFLPTIGDGQEDFVRSALAHELNHVKSGDLAWRWIENTLRIALWFHPLMWLVVAAHRISCEHRCDAEAADHVGRGAYVREVAAFTSELVSPKTPTGAMAFLGREFSPVRRLRRVEENVRALRLQSRWVVSFCGFWGILTILLGLVSFHPLPSAVPVERLVEWQLDTHPSGHSNLEPTILRSAEGKLEASALTLGGLRAYDIPGDGDFVSTDWAEGSLQADRAIVCSVKPRPGHLWQPLQISFSLVTQSNHQQYGPSRFNVKAEVPSTGASTVIETVDIHEPGSDWRPNIQKRCEVTIKPERWQRLGLQGLTNQEIVFRIAGGHQPPGDGFGGLANSLHFGGGGSNVVIEGIVRAIEP